MTIKLFNTLTKQIEQLRPLVNTTVRMYSCGPTVYDVAHIGNMRSFLAADLIQRTVRAVGGYEVRWVMNITDIDDKTIRDSAVGSDKWLPEMGIQSGDARSDLRAYTEYYEKLFVEDLAQFGINTEQMAFMPRATEFIPHMQDLIREIVRIGHGYVSEGSVYFNVDAYSAAHEYGRLFAIDKDNFRKGVRIDADEYDRESVSDFVLWKAAKEGEPAWDFELDGVVLPGRPGWHIECSAMSKELLGLPFDIHTGGVDLRFPHHEDELAQCTSGYHVPEQATIWMHNEFLEVEGMKMSKSLGNFYTLRDLAAKGLNPLDVRFAMLHAHYRTVLNFTEESVTASATSRKKLQDYVYEVWSACSGVMAESVAGVGLELQSAVFEHLANDIHTPRALAALFTFVGNNPVRALSTTGAQEVLRALYTINEVFAVLTISAKPSVDIPENVQEIANARWQARSSKNWAESDRLREELLRLGWAMNDGKDGFTLEPQS